MRPAFFASQIAPATAGAFKTAIHDKAEVFYPLGAIVLDLASAGVVRYQPVQKALRESVRVLAGLFIGKVQVKQRVR